MHQFVYRLVEMVQSDLRKLQVQLFFLCHAFKLQMQFFCHAFRVNYSQKQIKNWYAHRLTILVRPSFDLKVLRVLAKEISSKTQDTLIEQSLKSKKLCAKNIKKIFSVRTSTPFTSLPLLSVVHFTNFYLINASSSLLHQNGKVKWVSMKDVISKVVAKKWLQ